MSRKPIKTIDNTPEEYIPESHREFDKNAKEMQDRPLIFVGIKPNRDQKYAAGDFTELKDLNNPKKGINGMGKVLKYYFENIIHSK